VKSIYVVIGALLLLLLGVGVLIGLELQPSEQQAAPTTEQQAAPTTSLHPNYGKASGAEGGATVYGPCVNGHPPASHWICTSSVTPEEFAPLARQMVEEQIRGWLDSPEMQAVEPAEEFCARIDHSVMPHGECIERLTAGR
jgi:hypothetical protein